MRTFVLSSVIFGAAAAACVAVSTAAHGAITATFLYQMTKPAGYSSAGPGVYQGTAGGEVVASGIGTITNNNFHAVMWNTSGTFIDMNPSGFRVSEMSSVNGGVQFGDGIPTSGNGYHALVWNGTNAAIDIHPAAYFGTHGTGIRAGVKVGYSEDGNSSAQHALIWDTANVVTDLHPAGYLSSFALGLGDGQVVGEGRNVGATQNHALLWNGTNPAAIDLHPTSGFSSSAAFAVRDGQQGGQGNTTTNPQIHALLWNGTNAAIDLHPTQFQFPTFDLSLIRDVDDGWQVGWGHVPGTNHALLWHGSAASAVDLHSALTSIDNTIIESYAYSIEGNQVYGYAGRGNGTRFAVVWTVPEPSSCALMTVALGGALARRRRAR